MYPTRRILLITTAVFFILITVMLPATPSLGEECILCGMPLPEGDREEIRHRLPQVPGR